MYSQDLPYIPDSWRCLMPLDVAKYCWLRVIPDSLIYPWLDLFVPDQMAPLGRCFSRISRAAAFDHSHQFCISSSLNSLLTVYMYQYILVPYITRTRFSRSFQQCNLFVRAISISQDILDSVNTGTFP